MEQLSVGGAQDPCVYFQLFAVYLEIPGRRNYNQWQTQIRCGERNIRQLSIWWEHSEINRHDAGIVLTRRLASHRRLFFRVVDNSYYNLSY